MYNGLRESSDREPLNHVPFSVFFFCLFVFNIIVTVLPARLNPGQQKRLQRSTNGRYSGKMVHVATASVSNLWRISAAASEGVSFVVQL